MVEAPGPGPRSLQIVFFGTPAFAVPTLERLLASRHRVCGVVTQPDRPRGRGQQVTDAPVKRCAMAHRLAIIQPNRLRDPAVEDTLREWAPDLGVVAAYGKMIPDRLLEVPPLGMINVHASLLPKYRGAAPVHRAIIDGERETGVTIMRVARLLDTGNMFASVRRSIGPEETSETVERDLATLGADLLVRVVDQIADGSAREELQDDMLSSYAARLKKDEGLIDWDLPASFIHNRVRGLHPWPHAYTYLDGARVIVRATQVREGASDAPPGTVVAVTHDAIEAATGHRGRIALVEVQREGRRPMPVRDFLRGHTVTVGARFTNR